jgi:3-hydroxyisobutyrate dehydrogenase-like beta-hydroxyacid dehydrogenase
MSHDKMRVGLIGLGLLGSAMAERLLQHGFAVRGFDLDAQRREELASLGGEPAAAAGDVLAGSEVVLLSLPTSEVVATLIRDCGSRLNEGQILIDTTTGDPEQMMALGNQLRDKNVHYVEATVAGSSRQMRNGSATLFLGGDAKVIQSQQKVFEALSAKSFHLSGVGAASRFKLVHNLILGLHRAVLAEGLCFAESLGFAPADVLAILKQTPAASAVMDSKGEKMVSRDWSPEARLSQHLKDVRLILESAERTGTPAPLSQVHRELLEQAEQLGFGEADNTAILEAYRRHPA